MPVGLPGGGMLNFRIDRRINTDKMCLLLTILRLESFVETGVRDLENDLFF